MIKRDSEPLRPGLMLLAGKPNPPGAAAFGGIGRRKGFVALGALPPGEDRSDHRGNLLKGVLEQNGKDFRGKLAHPLTSGGPGGFW